MLRNTGMQRWIRPDISGIKNGNSSELAAVLGAVIAWQQ